MPTFAPQLVLTEKFGVPLHGLVQAPPAMGSVLQLSVVGSYSRHRLLLDDRFIATNISLAGSAISNP
jgi:hypothetical protein